jgi:hypothetical protein
MAKGKWQRANGKWQMANAECRMPEIQPSVCHQLWNPIEIVPARKIAAVTRHIVRCSGQPSIHAHAAPYAAALAITGTAAS